jgi:outer membrane protein OmpA-like peptidoglycan-associated protein
MSGARHVRGPALVVAATLVAACAPARVSLPERPGETRVVLLADPEAGSLGGVTVSNPSGRVDLSAARASTVAVKGQPPAPAERVSESEVKRLFGDALEALPPPPLHFTLFFRFESDELTDASRALVPEILRAVKDRPVPEVVVVGHTDTSGTPSTNYDLGLKRAAMVRTLLIETGLDASLLDLASHGEGDLLVPTADGVLEPRNRRVEITIK